MQVTAESMLNWLETLLNANGKRPERTLREYLAAIPRLDSLSNVPSGTPVLIRGDVDAKPGAQIGEGDIRLRSMVETLEYGRKQGWKMIIFGHRGRKPEESLAKVAARLGELLKCEVSLVTDWLDETSLTIPAAVTERIK